MKTEQIFRKIYQELKEQISNNNDVFIKEYVIPSINYDPDNENIDNKYFASGIVMELDRMMGFFENKIYYSSYKDKYFFSNNEEKTKERMITEINNDMPKDNTSKEELLKGKLFEKVENEYKKFENELRQKTPDEIIENAYKLTAMDGIIEELKERSFDLDELKALLKESNLLGVFYTDATNDTRQEKIALIKYTYEQVLATQAEQVNGKSDNIDNLSSLGKNLIKEDNIVDIIPKENKFNVI